jgi:tetratricopeptide (TPR) repeat protein
VSTLVSLVETLLKEAVSRRADGEYQLALAHLEQAVELDANNGEAYRELGRTLSYFASETAAGDEKKRLLDRAEVALRRAAELPGVSKANCLHDLAWVFDERRDFDTAIDLYRQAQKANTQESRPAAFSTALSYNLACALAKAERYSEALNVLASVVKDARKLAEEDPDFAPIRASGEWGPKFRELVASDR